MALVVKRKAQVMSGIVADRRLYLTADKARVVEEGDASAAFLLAAPGTEITPEEVKRLGLSVKDELVVLPGAVEAEASATDAGDGGESESTTKKGRRSRSS